MLLEHLAIVEDHGSTPRLDDGSVELPRTEMHDGTPEWEFRTAGHADPLREAVDGFVGADLPAD